MTQKHHQQQTTVAATATATKTTLVWVAYYRRRKRQVEMESNLKRISKTKRLFHIYSKIHNERDEQNIRRFSETSETFNCKIFNLKRYFTYIYINNPQMVTTNETKTKELWISFQTLIHFYVLMKENEKRKHPTNDSFEHFSRNEELSTHT